MIWIEVEHGEYRLNINPFSAYIILYDDCANCVVRYGDKTDDAVISGKESHLDSGKKWVFSWLDAQTEDFARKISQARQELG